MTFSETQLSFFSFLKCLYLQDVPRVCHVVWISLNITSIRVKGNGKCFLGDIPHNVMILHMFGTIHGSFEMSVCLWSCLSSYQMLTVMLRYWWSLNRAWLLVIWGKTPYCISAPLWKWFAVVFFQSVFPPSKVCNVSWWPPI